MTAADQTPATDSERVDRLREARDLVQEARVSGFTQIDSDTVFAIDDELTRLTAEVGRLRDANVRVFNTRVSLELYRSRGERITKLTAELAERDATIEALGLTRAEDLNYQRGLEGRISAVQKAADTLLPFDQRNILAALGGHDLTQTPSGVRP